MRGVNGQVRPKSVANIGLMQRWSPTPCPTRLRSWPVKVWDNRALTMSQFHNCCYQAITLTTGGEPSTPWSRNNYQSVSLIDSILGSRQNTLFLSGFWALIDSNLTQVPLAVRNKKRLHLRNNQPGQVKADREEVNLRVGQKFASQIGVFPEALVFAAREGRPFDRHNLSRRQLKTTCKKLGVEGVSWHWLRHANATLLDAVGTPLGTVQALLGHSSSEITREVYLHSIPADARKAVEKVEELLNRDPS